VGFAAPWQVVNEQTGEPESRAERRKFGWRSLAEAGVWALVVAGIATMVFIIGGVSDPGLPITLATMLVGLALTTRDRRSGPIVLLITSAFLLIFAAFFGAQVFRVPQSTLFFVVNVVFVVAGVSTFVSSIMLLRGRGQSPGARRLGLIALAVMCGLTVVAIMLRVAYEEPASGSGDLNIAAEDNDFLPDEATVAAGRVNVVVDNEDLSIHTFSIEEFEIDEYLPGGVNSAVAFDAEPGTYVYFCTIPGHEEMKGTLRVE
jgi:plastocyanin